MRMVLPLAPSAAQIAESERRAERFRFDTSPAPLTDYGLPLDFEALEQARYELRQEQAIENRADPRDKWS